MKLQYFVQTIREFFLQILALWPLYTAQHNILLLLPWGWFHPSQRDSAALQCKFANTYGLYATCMRDIVTVCAFYHAA